MKMINDCHRPCVPIAVCLSTGIGLHHIYPKVGLYLALVELVLILAWFMTRKRWISWLTVQILVMICGIVLLNQNSLLPPGHIGRVTKDERFKLTSVEGVVNSPVIYRHTIRGIRTSFELQVERIEINGNWQSRCGKILVNIFREQKVQYGDLIRVSGKLHKPFKGTTSGHFSYEEYLERNGIYWIFSVKKSLLIEVLERGHGHWLKAAFLKIHARLQRVLHEHLNEFEAGFIQSLVLGGKYYIPDRTRDLFVQTGTAHILAISGMNVASMAFLVFIVLNVIRIPRKGQLLLTSLFLVFYCSLTGTNPSVLRATIMAVVMLFGFIVEREENTLNSLGFAAIIILLLDPLTLFDIGFQLSFTGVFSIVVIYPRIYKLVEPLTRGKISKVISQMLSVSLAAWLGVLPLIGYYFQVVTPVSILANIPIIPFVTALFMLGAGMIGVGLISSGWAALFASCIKVILFLLMIIVDLFSRVPYGCLFISEIKPWIIMSYYLFMGILLLCLRADEGTKEQPRSLHYLS